MMFSSFSTKAIAAGIVVLALASVPAPLLPPHRLAQAVQSVVGVNWKMAYLMAAVSTQFVFYGSLGVLAILAVDRAHSTFGRLLQFMVVPCAVVGMAVLIRLIKVGQLPVPTNSIVPIIACMAGVGFGFGLRYRGSRAILVIAAVLVGAALWAWLAVPSSQLADATEVQMRHLIAAEPMLPDGDARFGALMRTAFAPLPDAEMQSTSVIEHNRAAIVALGITLGDERLARMVGLHTKTQLLHEAAAVRAGTTLRGRDDWVKHFSLSAALAVLQHPFASDAAGLMKEQLDALAQGTGFSFADLAADRAGVRFAAAATDSEASGQAIRARLERGFVVGDFFPPTADLPESLSVEQFRKDYGRVGGPRYRQLAEEIEARLDTCPGLARP